MSHPVYNPYVPGKSSSVQGQYGEKEGDSRRTSSRFGSGSSFGSSGVSSQPSANSGGTVPSLLDLPLSYRTELSRATVEDSRERAIDKYISSGGEERSHQPVDRGCLYTSSQREEFSSSNRGPTSYSRSLSPPKHSTESGSSTLDWLRSYKEATGAQPSKYYPAALSSYQSSGDTRFIASSEQERDGRSIPRLSDYDYPTKDKPLTSSESSRPRFTSESAFNILLHFGLQKEDLEHLSSFPEDQMTPENLPFILRQIRLEKDKRSAPTTLSTPYHDPQPTTSFSGMDKPRSSEQLSGVHPSKVIDYGHLAKYTEQFDNEPGRISDIRATSGGSMLLRDSYDGRRHSIEPVQSSASMKQSSIIATKPLPTDSKTGFFSPFTQPNKDTGLGIGKILKPVPVEDPSHKSTLKNVPPPTQSLIDMHPNRPGLVLIDPQSQTQKLSSKTAMAENLQQLHQQQQFLQQQQLRQQLMQQQQLHHQQLRQLQQQFKQQTGQTAGSSTATQVSSSFTRWSAPFSKTKHELLPMPNQSNLVQTSAQTPNQQQAGNVAVSRSLPSPAQMQDYAAASPRAFPHTCTLCNKECPHLKDWISHQNTGLHLQNCKNLRKQYPNWDGLGRSSGLDEDATGSSSTSAQKTRCESSSPTRSRSPHRSDRRRDRRSVSHSRSQSPQRYRDSRRERRSSRSPHSSRHSRSSTRYDRPTSSRYRSRSRSYDRGRSPRRNDEKRRSHERHSSSRRSREEQSSPERSGSRRKQSSSADKLAKKLLETSALQSLSKKSDLQAVVKSLAPALLAELAKMKSSPSSSSSSSPSRSPSYHKKRSSPADSKPATPFASVTLRGIDRCFSHGDVENAVEKFGKIAKVVLYRSKRQAVAYFEREEDAQKLRKINSFTIKELPVYVAHEETDIKELPDKKSVKKTTDVTSKQAVSSAKTGNKTKKVAAVKKENDSESSEGPPDSTQKSASKKSVKDESPAEVDQLSNATAPKQVGRSVAVAKAEASKAEMSSTAQKAKTQAKEAPTKEKVEGTSAKAEEVLSKSSASEVQKGDAKVPKATSVTGDKTKVTEAKTAAPSKVKAQPMEVASPTEDKQTNKKDGEKQPPTTTVGTTLKQSVPKPFASPLQILKPGQHMQQKSAVGPAKPAVEAKTTLKQSVPKPFASPLQIIKPGQHMQQKSAVGPAKPAVEAKKIGPVAGMKTQKDPKSEFTTNSSTKVSALVKTEQAARPLSKPQSSFTFPADDLSLTFGEKLEKHLNPGRISCVDQNFPLGKLTGLDYRVLFISNLPEYYDGCYTEQDIANLLIPFGFEYKDDSIYVIPQCRMAFARYAGVTEVRKIVLASKAKSIIFKGSKLSFEVEIGDIAMAPMEFYKTLLKQLSYSVNDNGAKTIYVKNISPDEARDLRNTSKRIQCVKNYLPLLNKVFIEFESLRDTDRLGVWYSFLKQPPHHQVYRLGMPRSGCTALSPRMGNKAVPDWNDVIPTATSPKTIAIPQRSASPFWITMTTSPYLFPTMSPWFNIPKYIPVNGLNAIEKAQSKTSGFSTIMLTGLPEGNYKQEDVAKLVWRYFNAQTLHTLYYKIMVLSLQRRAFVFFPNQEACCDCVQEHLKKPFSVGGTELALYFVSENMNPGFREETMYKSMMKWSNCYVPDLVPQRLLCVEIEETNVDLVTMVIKEVASIASFNSFLPLASRICIEMSEPSGVTQVLQKVYSKNYTPPHQSWSKILRIESLKNLKDRLSASSRVKINFELKAKDIVSPAQTSATQPPPTDGTQPAALEKAIKESCDKPGAEIGIDSAVAPQPGEAGDKAEIKKDSSTTSSAAADGKMSDAHPASSVVKSEKTVELPHIDEDIYKALTQALREHRLSQEVAEQGKKKEDRDVSSQDASTSKAHSFEELNFSFEDLVTLDEIGEDTAGEDRKDRSSFSSEQTSKRETKTRSSSIGKTSAQSSRDTGNSSSSSESKTSEKSNSSSSSKSKDSSKATKSPSKTKASSPAPVSKTCTSSASLPVKPSVSSDEKAPPKKMISDSKTSNTSPSTPRTRSSETASLVAAETSLDTDQPHDERSPSESAVAKSDHKVSAKSIAAETVESETKMETSEMHPPAQESELDSQSAKVEKKSKDDTPEEVTKGEGNEDDTGKSAEKEKVEGEHFQILDSVEEQMDEDGKPDGSNETQVPVSEQDKKFQEDACQLMDGVEDQAKAFPKECSEMEIDSSVPVQHSVAEDQAICTTKPETEENESSQINTSLKATVEDVHEADKPLDTSSSQTPANEKDESSGNSREEFCKDLSKTGQITNVQGQVAVQDEGNKDTTDGKQETFDQSGTQNNNQKTEEKEQDTFQVIDSVEDEPTTTETKPDDDHTEKRHKKDDSPSERVTRATRRSTPRTRAAKSEEEKPSKTEDQTGKEQKSDHTEVVYEIIDSVEDESIQDTSSTGRSGRRRPARGKRETRTTPTEQSVKLDREEENSYTILDTVDDESAIEDTPMRTRSSRGRRERTTKEEESPTKRRQTPVRDSQEQNRSRTLNSEEKTALKESTPTKKKAVVDERDVACAAVSDSGEDKVGDVQPAAVEKPRRGRRRRGNKAAKKRAELKDDSSNKVADEEETTYEIVDSVEDETVNEQSLNEQSRSAAKPTESSEATKTEDEDEPEYQILDSLEDDRIQEEQIVKELSGTDRTERNETQEEIKSMKDEAPAENKGTSTYDTTAEKESEQMDTKEIQCQKEEENMEKIHVDPSASEGPGREEQKNIPTTDIQEEDKPAAESRSDTATQEEKQQEKSPKKESTVEQSSLANLDQVSHVDYPDNTADEELQKRQEAAKEKQLSKEREERRNKERERRSCSRGSDGSRGKERRAKERQRENVDLDTSELVTLDEVGADETGEEDTNKEAADGEVLELITLDEVVEEEEEQGKEEVHPPEQENQLFEASSETPGSVVDVSEENKVKPAEEEAEKTSTSVKRKRDSDTEESVNFKKVDEVGETEEEEKEAVTTKTRGQSKKRTRLSPERTSTRNKQEVGKDETDEETKEPPPPASLDSSSVDQHPFAESGDGQREIQSTEGKVTSQSDADTISVEQQPEPKEPEIETAETCIQGEEKKEEEPSSSDVKVIGKRKMELVGPEAKRACAQSPSVSFKLPPFKPNNPLGQEFVVPKSGFFCNLCSVFYMNEKNAKDIHCSTQKHYQKLQKYYDEHQQKS